MIPKNIIEKAIAGGWNYPPWFEDTYFLVQTNTPTADKILDTWTALDPDFWMALGKEMGWQDAEFFVHDKAPRFYDLILRKASQEEMDSFWKSL